MRRLLALLLTAALLVPLGTACGETVDDLIQKGYQFVQEADYESANICLDIAMKLAPDNPEVWKLQIMSSYQQGQKERTLKHLDKALELSPADGELYLVKAMLLFEMDWPHEGDLALRYAEICGEEATEHICLEAALSHLRSGNDAKAIEYFDSVPAEQWWDEHGETYGRALIRTGQRERAESLGLFVTGAKNEMLAAAIANGQTPVLAPMEKENVENYPVYVSMGFYEANKEAAEAEGIVCQPSADGLRTKIADSSASLNEGAEVALMTSSPSGEIKVYSLDGLLAVCKNQELTLVEPNAARGAQEEDPEAKNYKYFSQFGRWLEQGSITWSSDERYFALTFPNRTLQQARYLDMMLVDTWTGDLFVTEATPRKHLEGGLTVTAACFDASGKNLYYLAYGLVDDDSLSGLKRYNLETGETELLCGFGLGVFAYYPGLYMHVDGTIHGITDHASYDECAGRITIAQQNGIWERTVEKFAFGTYIQRPIRYLYSTNSEYELILNRITAPEGAPSTVFHYLTLQNESLGHDKALCFTGIESGTAELIEVNPDFQQWFASVDDGVVNGSVWMNVQNAILSPDGYFALLDVIQMGERRLYVLDLQTLAYVRVQTPQELSAAFGQTDTMIWTEDDQIIIVQQDKNITGVLMVP